ncbi:M28 family peptidase [Gracilimonas amylolytica]|uniref:M28 family peptidase n=1 Tax=Gracilimonas amylolytica TaxID=1749045 RepID=UPI000CD92CE4|nr:M28 family peptidase [Gracilimonas amylolytica]
MTKNILITALLAAFVSCSTLNSSKQAENVDIFSFADEITIEKLHSDLAVLAHDSLQGRETGTIGEQKAANYLAKRYKEMGLKAVGDNNSYFQHYELIQPAVDEINYTLTNSETGEVADRSVHNKTESGNFVTIFGGNDPLQGKVAFVGAGMIDEEAGIDHFPENLEGKWVLVFYEEGKTDMRYLQSVLSNEGALGTILVIGTDVEDFEQEAESRMSGFGQGRGLSLKYLQDNNSGNAPAFNRVHPQLGAEMLGLQSLEALEEMQQRIFSQPESFEAYDLNFTLEHRPVINENIVETQNVVAFLEGSDPAMKHEVVILSSHYDHVGVGRPDSTGDNIYNGADDDGSGTTASLQTAEAMMKAKNAGVGPKRSVLFINVSGEEKGLLGSRYYSDHPIYSIQNTVANINMDMIGRVDPEHVEDSSYVYIIGGEIISSGMDSLARVANEMGPNMTLSKRYNDLNDPNQFYRRSDHWNFGRLGVPFVFFFNGTHEDYHRPQDHIEKITFQPFLERTHLVYNLTALLANSPERPMVDNQEFIEKTQVQPR